MKVLVTGTAGFIGFHLVNKLLKETNWQITGLDSINDYYDVNLKYSRLHETGIDKNDLAYNKLVASKIDERYQFIQLNLEDKENLDDLFASQKFDYVCNLAAQAGVRYSLTNPHAYLDSNWHGFLNILEASRHNQVKHFVYASSSSVYGLNETMPFSTHNNVDHPVSLYAASKKSNELMAHTYSHLFNIPTTGLRFFTVYGPWGRPDMAFYLFTTAIFADKPINVFNNGQMERDFTYIDDIVEGVYRVIKSPAKSMDGWDGANPDPSGSVAPYKIYNIGNNAPVKLMDFIAAIEKHLGKTAVKNMMPIQPGDVAKTYADVQDLIDDMGYKPNTSIDEGVKNFIDWYLDYTS